MPKLRGSKKKHRAEIKISDITAEGFRLRTFNRDYYVSREDYPWFKDATHREIQDVVLYTSSFDDPSTCLEEGDTLHWVSLDVILGTNTFEYPERFPFRSPSVRGELRLDLFERKACQD